jgi:ankyrin repeat protein
MMSSNENTEYVRQLLDKGADVTVKRNDGRTPFLLAAKKGDMRSMVPRLKKGADVQAKDKNGFSAMTHAALSRKNKSILEPIIRLLIETGIDVDSNDSDGRTPLSNLVDSCWLDRELQIVRLLLENGADSNSSDNSGRSVFFMGVQESHSIARARSTSDRKRRGCQRQGKVGRDRSFMGDRRFKTGVHFAFNRRRRRCQFQEQLRPDSAIAGDYADSTHNGISFTQRRC